MDRRKFVTATAAGVAACALPKEISRADDIAECNWIELFDGQSLDGWHTNTEDFGHGTGGTWQVEEGTFTGEQDPPGSGNGGILLTDGEYSEFVLELELKPDWGICSGVFVRSTERGESFQMLVDYHDNGNIGFIYGEHTTGFNTALFSIHGDVNEEGRLVGLDTKRLHESPAAAGLVRSCTPIEWLAEWKIGRWNRARIRVEGKKYPMITTWINNLEVCKFDAATSSASKYDREKIAGMLGTSGRIAVQVHGGKDWPEGGKCRWRNIRICEL